MEDWPSTRISNELGAEHPQAARLALRVGLVMALAEGIVVGVVLVLIRNVWGYAYSNEAEVVRYVATMMPILATSNLTDGLQCVLSGAVRGCGWQKMYTGQVLSCGHPGAHLGSVDGDYMRAVGASRMLFDHHVADKLGTSSKMNLI
ncbi:Protein DETOXIFICATION 16 [Salvia divinorum]|uniref:Protein DETOXIFICATION 16 n=1 Tax=Salvia divinorum TaxID=28513 RepID=A0ABD1HEE9_SALDI